MAELESRAKAQGITEISLNVSLPSRKFYERLGYDVLAERSFDVGEGQFFEVLAGEKDFEIMELNTLAVK